MASPSGHASPVLEDAELPPNAQGSHHHGIGGDGHGSGSIGDQPSPQDQNLHLGTALYQVRESLKKQEERQEANDAANVATAVALSAYNRTGGIHR